MRMKKEWFGLFLLCLFLCGFFLGFNLFGKKEEKDAIKFKKDYESLNGTTTKSGKEVRSVSISDKNPFVYKEAEDIVEMIRKKETFIVYFGFNSCPWCRSVVEILDQTARELKINEIYYVDVLNIRDTYKLNENGQLEKTKDGSKGYMDLLPLLSDVLSDYTLKNSEGETISVGEKRIYAPNVVAVVKGEAKALTTGISPLETDAYMELTEEMKAYTKEEFTNIFQYLLKDSGDTCDKDTPC